MAKLNTQTSIVDYLKSQGKDSSYSARKDLATSMGIANYTGTPSQNTQMLKALQNSSSTNTITKASNASTSSKTTTGTATTTTAQAKTNTNTKAETKTTLNGVDEATNNKLNSTFAASDKQTTAQGKADNALTNLESVTSNKNIVGSNVYAVLGSQFQVPQAVTEADAYLATQLEKIQSGKTSYTDQVKDMMSQIQNREKFSYDVDSDPLFQQALSSAMNSGKTAMQDTIGQASALTGGYGSTYATTAGNQAYNAFIEDAYNNLPQYYQMAMDAYQMEGDEMYRQLGMLTDADETEYNRNLNAYDATYQHRNQMYNEAYTQFRDSKTDALNIANLKLSEHGQIVSDAYNLYNATSNYADTLYNREYTKWQDEVNQAMQYAGMLNTDYWNQTNFDEGVRQYEQSFAEDVRQYDTSLAENQRQFDKSYDQTEKWNQKDLDYKYSALKQDNDQFYANLNYQKSKAAGGGAGGGSSYKLSTAEINGMQKACNDAGGGEAGIDAAMSYLSALGKAPTNADEANIVYNALGINSGTGASGNTNGKIDWTTATITKSKDTMNGILGVKNIWGGIDNNDQYTINGKTYYIDDIEDAMKADGIPQATIDTIIKNINGLKENGTYKYK